MPAAASASADRTAWASSAEASDGLHVPHADRRTVRARSGDPVSGPLVGPLADGGRPTSLLPGDPAPARARRLARGPRAAAGADGRRGRPARRSTTSPTGTEVGHPGVPRL